MFNSIHQNRCVVLSVIYYVSTFTRGSALAQTVVHTLSFKWLIILADKFPKLGYTYWLSSTTRFSFQSIWQKLEIFTSSSTISISLFFIYKCPPSNCKNQALGCELKRFGAKHDNIFNYNFLICSSPSTSLNWANLSNLHGLACQLHIHKIFSTPQD